MLHKRAVIHALWIGVAKPELVSRLIQRVIGQDYSHNAFIYEKTGHLWEATFCDDPKYSGVVERPDLHKAMEGCIIRARKRIVLNISEEGFEHFLETERGKPYAFGQGYATIFKWLAPWTRNGDLERHCSEFLAWAAMFAGYSFNCKDSVTPFDTFQAIRPVIVNEVVDENWVFRR